ncbi:MAG: GAF domain-containing protein, partial [Candidatus Sumerlaeota bacterium]
MSEIQKKTDTSHPKRSRKAYLDLFSHLSQIISHESDLSKLIKASLDIIQSSLDVKDCSIMLLNPEGTALNMLGSTRIPEENWSKISIRLGDGIAGRVAESGEAIMVTPDKPLPAEDQALTTPRERYRSDSFISVPLHIIDEYRIIGVLNVTDHMDNHAMTEFDLEVLEAIGQLVASAIDSHRLWVRTHEARQHLSRVMNGVPIGMFTISTKGKMTLCNHAARDYLNVLQSAELGRSWQDYFSEDIKKEIHRSIDELMSGNSSYSCEFKVSDRKDGTEHKVRLSALKAEELSSSLETNYALFLVEDLRQTQELAELRRSDQMKSNFLSLISHELRTPLAAMKGAIHILNQMSPPDMREKASKVFTILYRNSDRLTGLVNNILDVLDLEGHTLTLYRKRRDMNALTTSIVENFKARAIPKNIHWEVDLSAERSEIYVDEGRVSQVLTHLIENAVKFVCEGGTISLKSHSEDKKWVLRLCNTGPCINRRFKEK